MRMQFKGLSNSKLKLKNKNDKVREGDSARRRQCIIETATGYDRDKNEMAGTCVD